MAKPAAPASPKKGGKPNPFSSKSTPAKGWPAAKGKKKGKDGCGPGC
jgi:hypothetical protein